MTGISNHQTNKKLYILDEPNCFLAGKVYSVGDPNTEMLTLINNYRSKRNLNLLKIHSALVKSAQLHSNEMVKTGQLSHYSENGQTWVDRQLSAGYDRASFQTSGEDIGEGQTSVEQLFHDFLSDEGHRRPIILPENQHCGLGVAQNNYGMKFWTLDFAYGGKDDNTFPANNLDRNQFDFL